MKWCHGNITQGKIISVIGPLESSYRDSKFSIVVNAHTLVTHKETESMTNEVIQKELPYE